MVGDKNKLRNLRTGRPAHKNVTLGYGDASVEVIVVALSIDIMQQVEETVEEYCQKYKNKVNDSVRSQYYNRVLAYHCMRDPEDTTFDTKIAESPHEVGAIMDLEDISRVINAYSELMINKAPKIEMLTEDQFIEIKKHLEVTALKDLSTVLLIHLTNCHQTLASEI